MLFLVRILPFLRKIADTDYPGYGYFQNPEGAMNREFSSKYMDQITCWELAREEALKLDSLKPFTENLPAPSIACHIHSDKPNIIYTSANDTMPDKFPAWRETSEP